MQSRSKIIILGILALVVIVGIAYLARPRNAGTDGVFNPPSGWQTFTDAAQGATFSYPEAIEATYIYPVDWPPKLQVVAGAFSCTEAGSEIQPAGKTTLQTVKGRAYCLTQKSEGAAGSIYTQYAYAFPKGGKVATLTFTLRFVQCANYDAPQTQACQAERQAFSMDDTVDTIALSLKVAK